MTGACSVQDHERDRQQQILNTVLKLERQEHRLSDLVDRINAQESLTEAMKCSVIQGRRLNDLSSDMERRNVNVILHGLQEISGVSDENILYHFLMNDLAVAEDTIKNLKIISTKRIGKAANRMRPLIITTEHKSYVEKILNLAKSSHQSRRFSRDRPLAIQIARRRLNPYFDQCKQLSNDVKVVWPATLLVDGIIRYQFFQGSEFYELDLQEQSKKESLNVLEQWIQLQQGERALAQCASTSEELPMKGDQNKPIKENTGSTSISSTETIRIIESPHIYESGPQLTPVVPEEITCSCSVLTHILMHYDRG